MRFLKLIFVLVLFLLIPASVYALNLPKYSGRVNDFAQIFSSDFKSSLEQKLSQIETNTTDQIAVVTVKNLQGTTIEDFAEQLFKSWGIGQKGKDNGLLVLVALEERQVRIEVGYGLESTITDGRAGDVIRNYITPEFKKSNYEKGISDGIDRLNQYLTGEVTDNPPVTKTKKVNSDFVVTVIILVLSFLSYAFAFMARTKSFYAGGIGGSIIGFIIGLFASLSVAITLFFIIGIIGLFLDFILSKNYQRLQKMGKKTGFWSSGGGFWGGGGSSGGGFGGFGGGSSGGGGSSSSW